MDALAQLAAARRAGLRVYLDGGKLTVSGKPSLRPHAEPLFEHRDAVTAALIAESENWCISATLTQAPRANDVAPWPGAAADFAMLLTADDLPGVPFQFGGPHCVIADGRRFLASLQADVRRGIDGPRAMYGAVQTDLIRLCEILTTTESRRPLLAASAVSAAVHWLHHGYTPPEGVDMKRVATGNLIGNVVP